MEANFKIDFGMKYNRIGVYFGSFNPIHEGHIHIVETALKACIDKLYLVVSPQSPFKPLSELASFHDRLTMARLAIDEHGLGDKVEVVDWEEHLYPSYTATTLKSEVPILRENEVVIFMGLDNFLSIEKWKEPQYILKNYIIDVIPRGNADVIGIIQNKVKELHDTITPYFKGIVYSNPFSLVDISATEIRDRIAQNQSIDGLTCTEVRNYIKTNSLYA